MDTFTTIKNGGEGLYKEKGSKFIALAFHVETAEQALDIVAATRKKYFDARHVCFAYMLGTERNVFRANDDGEPSGTAGKPILGQIISTGLTDVLIIVIRYFGGILLGTGGLIVAYKTAAADAILNSETEEKIIESLVRIRCDYEAMNYVMRAIKDCQGRVVRQRQEMDCLFSVALRPSFVDVMRQKMDGVKGVEFKDKTDNEPCE